MPEEEIKPGFRSKLMVGRLLWEALLDLAALPFRLCAFLLRRKRIREDIHSLLRRSHDGQK